MADALALSQVLLNLVRNAMESMDGMAEQRISIAIEQQADRVLLRVRDWGCGLGEADQVQLGTPFFSTKAQGLGMGLNISRAIAQNHGGSLSVCNVADGPGAEALLDLPVAEAVRFELTEDSHPRRFSRPVP